MSTIGIRWMLRRDFPSVLAIENDCFVNTWTEDDFCNVLRQRNNIGVVAYNTHTDKILGFMIYKVLRNGFTILNLAISPNHRRQKIGVTFHNRLLKKLEHQQRHRILVDLREGNLNAQLFFKSLGYRAIKILHKYYNNDEDAYRMKYTKSAVATH